MLLWMYGMVGIIVWVWKCDCIGKQWRETRVLAQAGLPRPGEICRIRQIHTQSLAQAESSRLSEASRLGERGSPKRERVRTLARRCSFQPRQGTLFLSEETTRSARRGSPKREFTFQQPSLLVVLPKRGPAA